MPSVSRSSQPRASRGVRGDCRASVPCPSPWAAPSHCGTAQRAPAGRARSLLMSLSFSLSCQLPMPGGPAVVPGEVGEGDVAVRAGGLCGAGGQRAPPPPAVLLPRGQRGRRRGCGGGAHQVRAAGALRARGQPPGIAQCLGPFVASWRCCPRLSCPPGSGVAEWCALGQWCLHAASGLPICSAELSALKTSTL